MQLLINPGYGNALALHSAWVGRNKARPSGRFRRAEASTGISNALRSMASRRYNLLVPIQQALSGQLRVATDEEVSFKKDPEFGEEKSKWHEGGSVIYDKVGTASLIAL